MKSCMDEREECEVEDTRLRITLNMVLQNCTKNLKKSWVGESLGGCMASMLYALSLPHGISGTRQRFLAGEPVSWLHGVLGHLLFHSVSNQKILLDVGSRLGNGNYVCCHGGSFLHLAGSPGWNQHKEKIRK